MVPFDFSKGMVKSKGTGFLHEKAAIKSKINNFLINSSCYFITTLGGTNPETLPLFRNISRTMLELI